MIEKLKNTNHSYYCANSNYYVDGVDNYGLVTYDTWEDFKSEWINVDLSIDHDYNYCFRFDIKNKYNHEKDEESKNEYSLHLYFMLQRKGNFVPVFIKNLYDEDLEEVNKYLNQCWNYIKNQWVEFTKEV